MEQTLKLYKKVKIVLIIATIIIIILSIIGLLFILDEQEVIDLDKMLTDAAAAEEESGYSSDKVEAILQAAKKIKEYIADKKMAWSGNPSEFNFPRYNSGEKTKTCCATYVAWVLKEINLMDENTNINDVGTFDNFLSARPNEWKKISISNYSDLKPGDICIHRSKQNRSLVHSPDILIYMVETVYCGQQEVQMLLEIQERPVSEYLILHIDILDKKLI